MRIFKKSWLSKNWGINPILLMIILCCGLYSTPSNAQSDIVSVDPITHKLNRTNFSGSVAIFQGLYIGNNRVLTIEDSTTNLVNQATNTLWKSTTNLVTQSTNTLWKSTTNLVTQSTNTLWINTTNLNTQSTNNLWKSTTDLLDSYSYPVFTIDLGGNWTDFELKGSTNNFTNLCYYVMSHSTNEWTTDTNVWFFFTDDYSEDVRQWHKATLGDTIRSQLVDPINSEVERVILEPSHECNPEWQTWMSKTNDKLIWSYVRYDGIGFEMNKTGSKQHWNPIIPTEWRRARTQP